MMQPAATQPRTRTRLTNADYLAQTPPSHRGRRYQLINGELIEMAGATLAHQIFLTRLGGS